MKPDPSEEPLSALLQAWRVEAEPSARCAAEVWRRIAQREERPRFWQRWQAALTWRTDFAWGAAATVLIMLGAGWWGQRSRAVPAVPHAADSYLASVDPYRMTR